MEIFVKYCLTEWMIHVNVAKMFHDANNIVKRKVYVYMMMLMLNHDGTVVIEGAHATTDSTLITGTKW